MTLGSCPGVFWVTGALMLYDPSQRASRTLVRTDPFRLVSSRAHDPLAFRMVGVKISLS